MSKRLNIGTSARWADRLGTTAVFTWWVLAMSGLLL